MKRTLILPPWVEYRKGESRSLQVPFNTYFSVESLQKYHDVILMENFMAELAPKIWPKENRTSFCYMERKSSQSGQSKEPDCHAKEGNPFGPFWDTFGIDFTASEFFGPLHFDTHHSDMAEKWSEKYPAEKWPVIAFTGAPASFPVQNDNRHLHQYLEWNETILEKAQHFIKTHLPKGAFIGIHLRNGIDWVKACDHIRDTKQLFASPQCLGYNNERGQLYHDLCLPSHDIIMRQIKRLVKKVKQAYKNNEIRSVFVASDANHMIKELTESLHRMNISVHRLPEANDSQYSQPHLDLAILGLSNHFIGNCISSFTAFVKRERDVKGFPSYFWAYPKEKDKPLRLSHEEL